MDICDKNSHLSSITHYYRNSSLVFILLCTYNGAKYLAEQLNSIEAQTHKNWVVIASDDGSTDQTLEILQKYQAKWSPNKLTIRSGPKKGFCQNFLSLACDPKIKAEYYAFCDQDDVWLPSKLSVALENIITKQDSQVPYVYCGRTWYVSEQLKNCGASPLFIFPTNFRNALVQSIAGGNTMVFNQPTKSLVEQAGPLEVPSHDWWIYQLVTGVGGEVFYDALPQILYRQHDQTLVGGNNSFSAQLLRVLMLLQGRFKNWNSQNINSLKQVNHLLGKKNQEILRMFEILRGAKLRDRFRLLFICGLYRQTRAGTLSLFLAALIKKI